MFLFFLSLLNIQIRKLLSLNFLVESFPSSCTSIYFFFLSTLSSNGRLTCDFHQVCVCVLVINMSVTAKRGVMRANVTKLITKLDEIDKGVFDDDQKYFEFGAKLGALRDKHEQVLQFDKEKLLTCTTDQEVENAMNEAEAVNEKTADAIVLYTYKFEALERKLQAAREAAKPPPPPPPPPQTTIIKTAHTSKFQLPEFYGEIIDYRSFWDVFETEVHSNPSYSNATKFNFLNSCLKGRAKSSISGLAPNNDNYPVAVKILKDRYGQPKKVQAAYMRALCTIDKPNDSRSSLRAFADRLEALIRGLEALKVKLDGAAGDLLVSILQDKLSGGVRRSLVRQHGSTEFDLDEFRRVLQHEVEILEDVPVQQQSKKQQHHESNQQHGRERESRPPSNNSSSPP